MKTKKQPTKKEKVKIITAAKKFNQELKKTMNTAIVAAFGFLIALTWKEVITEYVDKISLTSPVQGKLISALIITIISIIGILIVTKLLRVEE